MHHIYGSYSCSINRYHVLFVFEFTAAELISSIDKVDSSTKIPSNSDHIRTPCSYIEEIGAIKHFLHL